MSTQDNLKIIKDAYGAFGRGDIPAVLAQLTDDVEWVVPGSTPLSGTYRGPAGVGKFFQTLAAEVDIQTFEPRQFLADGDVVVVLGWERSKVRKTNRMVENYWAMAYTLRDGKVTKYRDYSDTESWAKAYETTAGAGA